MTALTLSPELLIADALAPETLEELEAAIDDALAAQVPTFMAIGDALIKIRDRNLLRAPTYGQRTFERYIKARFGFCRSVAYDYMNAALVGPRPTS